MNDVSSLNEQLEQQEELSSDQVEQQENTQSDQEEPAEEVAADQAASPQKTRSPVERILVWGLIAGLVVLVGLQARARFAYTSTLKSLVSAVRESDRHPAADPLTLANARKLITGSPAVSNEKEERNKVVVYTWKGLLKSYSIRITITDDENPEVLSVVTPGAPDTSPVIPKQNVNEGDGSDDGEGDADNVNPNAVPTAGDASERSGRQRNPVSLMGQLSEPSKANAWECANCLAASFLQYQFAISSHSKPVHFTCVLDKHFPAPVE